MSVSRGRLQDQPCIKYQLFSRPSYQRPIDMVAIRGPWVSDFDAAAGVLRATRNAVDPCGVDPGAAIVAQVRFRDAQDVRRLEKQPVSARVSKAGRREVVPEFITIGAKMTTARGRRYLTKESTQNTAACCGGRGTSRSHPRHWSRTRDRSIASTDRADAVAGRPAARPARQSCAGPPASARATAWTNGWRHAVAGDASTS